MDTKEKLIQKYAENSKHSQYQAIPRCLQGILADGNRLAIKSRNEKERLEYILKKITIKDNTVTDVGGNTGFFSLEMLEAGAKRVLYIEGNSAHAQFVSTAADYLKLGGKLEVINEYMRFDKTYKKSDIMLLLNVLHHVGDDYGSSSLTIEEAKEQILKQLNSAAAMADTIVFQMGFNWKGDVKRCLFKKGTKKEMIDYVSGGVKGIWDIMDIGVAVSDGTTVVYRDLDDKNIQRDDKMGEFLNRPLFIMKRVKNDV